MSNKRGGDCFPKALEVAAEIIRTPEYKDDYKIDTVRVVHGLPIGTGSEIKDKRYWHAWVEVDASDQAMIPLTMVFDHSNGKDTHLPRAVYYAFGQITQDHVYRYTYEEARELALDLGHYGPWIDDYEQHDETNETN